MTMIKEIASCSRKGEAKSTAKYEKLIEAAMAAKQFGCNIESIYFNISLNISLIEKLDG